MSEVSDQCACRVAGQLRVGIQGDDVLDRTEYGRITDSIRECCLLASPQQSIELLQLSPLALISHPHPFVWIPHARSMKQIEDVRTVFAVGLVERLNTCARAGK
jgi:hypothetical protein